jgi:polysaccharide biosynthesis/export protein
MTRWILLLVGLFLITLPLTAAAADQDYVIGDGDGLQISVWGSPELSSAVTVRPDGKITLPAAGDIVASGYTPAQLSDKLAKDLTAFVRKPIVTVAVNNITNNKVYVFGGGASSGVFHLPGRTTLLRFLTNLGDLQRADLERAYLLRDGERIAVNFYDLFIGGNVEADVDLQTNDMVYIPDNELMKIYIMGAVGNPQYVFYREGIRILDAILESGGFTKFARENRVVVLRKEGNQMNEIRVNARDLMRQGDLSQNIELRRGDMVVVSEGIF